MSRGTITIYLLHFEAPYRHARHYLGSAQDLAARLAQHRSGQGARLLQVVTEAGISWDLVRTWEGDRALERSLKARHGPYRLCPLCKGVTRTTPSEEPSHAHG